MNVCSWWIGRVCVVGGLGEFMKLVDWVSL